tara:strand:+ start:57397 stop:59343 length:1947 start_codon:yes stop_codon:yes gene_type:complete
MFSSKLNALLFFLFISISVLGQKQIDQIKEQLKDTKLSDSTKIKLYGDLGWYYSNISIDSAFKYSKVALKLSKESKNQNGIAQSYNDIGIIHYRISSFDSSIVYYKKALDIRFQLKDSLRIAAIYNKIGIAHNQLFKLDSAIYYTLESLKIYEDLGLKKYAAVNYNNVANLYRDTKQYEKALKTHKLALKIRNEINDDAGKFQSYIGLGNVHVFLKQNDSAKTYYEKSIELGKKLNLKRDLSTSYNNLGNIYKEYGNYSKAIALFNNAYKIRKELNDNYGLASTSLNLGDLYIRTKRYTLSQKKLHESLKIAKETKAKELVQNIYRAFVQLKAYQRQPDSVIHYQERHQLLQESLLNDKILSQVSNFETKYETEKKEKEIVIQKQELLDQELKIKNRNLYIILISAVLLIILIISIGLYKKQQFKKQQLQKELDLKDALTKIKTQNKLQEQRLEISRDLHDNIGSQLTFIISSIDNLKYVSKDINDAFKNKLSSISSFTFDTIHQLRDTIWAMNKNEITINEFHSRTMSYIEKVKTAKPDLEFDVKNSISSEIIFSSVQGMNLFRVLQEAINNAIKHSEATKITISFKKENDSISFKIKDNGKGFDKENFVAGNGISNIENRISSINGIVFIDSKMNEGTTISIKLTV